MRKGRKRQRRQQPAQSALSPLVAAPNPLVPAEFPELVFGLVGPAGADRSMVIEILTKELSALNYRTHVVRLSKMIEKFFGRSYDSIGEDERIGKLMDDGTKIRETTQRGDAVVLLAIAEIRRVREQEFKNKPEKIGYILDSLKHPGEIATLRNVYGQGFQAVSIYSPRDIRVNALAKRIAQSRHVRADGARAKAESLIERDEEEEGKKLGQDVKEAFPEADFFVDGRTRKKMEETKRFVELIFSHPFHTPTVDEYGMYHARSAALRSADLGRQVGAVIATKDGDIIAVGCNEVPKAGGGLYWPGGDEDHRDFQRGNDASVEQREQILAELLNRFRDSGWLAERFRRKSIKDLVQLLLYGAESKVIAKTQILDLLEYGRSVHAEMAALMDAARRGVPVRDATMYCTTFPCHMCTRHIIAAGIDRIVYIEPYPKSRARELYGDSICVDQSAPVKGKVNFDPFVGVAPRQYLRLFEFGVTRKDERGKAIDWKKRGPKPRISRFRNTYQDIETTIVSDVIPVMMKQLGVNENSFPTHSKQGG